MDLHPDLEALRADLLASGMFTEDEADEAIERAAARLPGEIEDDEPAIRPGTIEHFRAIQDRTNDATVWQRRLDRWGRA